MLLTSIIGDRKILIDAFSIVSAYSSKDGETDVILTREPSRVVKETAETIEEMRQKEMKEFITARLAKD